MKWASKRRWRSCLPLPAFNRLGERDSRMYKENTWNANLFKITQYIFGVFLGKLARLSFFIASLSLLSLSAVTRLKQSQPLPEGQTCDKGELVYFLVLITRNGLNVLLNYKSLFLANQKSDEYFGYCTLKLRPITTYYDYKMPPTLVMKNNFHFQNEVTILE